MHKSLPILTSFAVISTLTSCTMPFTSKAPAVDVPTTQTNTGVAAIPESALSTGTTTPANISSGSTVVPSELSSPPPGFPWSSIGVMPDGSQITIPPITQAPDSMTGSSGTPNMRPTDPVPPARPVDSESRAVAPTAPPVSSADKTVTKVARYTSPGGAESIQFSVVVDAAGVIKKMTATPMTTHPISTKFQGNFSAGISSEVVGKKLSWLKLTAVSGASLTTGAFNEFISGL